MGFFDSEWLVEFEYCDSFLASYKKATIVVEASSEYSAKDKAKSVLKPRHKYLNILKVVKNNGSKGTYEIKNERRHLFSNYDNSLESKNNETFYEERERSDELFASEEDGEFSKGKEAESLNSYQPTYNCASEEENTEKTGLPVSFYVLMIIDIVLILISVGMLIIGEVMKKYFLDAAEEALQKGYKGSAAEYIQTANNARGFCVCAIVLLVVFAIFAAISLLFSFVKSKKNRR